MVLSLAPLAPFAVLVVLSIQPAIAQVQIAKLLPTNLAPGDELGGAIAMDGDWLMVGAKLQDDIADQSGAVWVYHRANGVWNQTQMLKASDASAGANFGWAVAMDGSRAVITAPADSPQGIFGAGSAYVFELFGATWVERAKLWANSAAYEDYAGQAVAISGDRVVVGSWSSSPLGLFSGEAYVFEGQGSNWTQVAQLEGNDTSAGDNFGWTVSIDGDRLAVGAPAASLPQGLWIGAAYIFERDAQGVWAQSAKVTSNDGLMNDFFGVVGLSGPTLAVGAPRRDDAGNNSGSVYFFDLQGTGWTQTQRVTGIESSAGDFFGSWLALRGDFAAMTTTSDADAGVNTGAAYVFHRTTSGWVQIGKLLANDGHLGQGLGYSVSLSGSTIGVGAPPQNDLCPTVPYCHSGAAYLFDVVPTAFQYGSCATGAPCSNPDGHGGCRNSTGQGAILGVHGSASIANDDLQFEVRHVPPGTSGLLFMGPAQTSAPFGDGRRVVTGGASGIFRLGIQAANTEGVITRGPGLVYQSLGLGGAHIGAGQAWNFQCWYRNTAGPCGSHFNLSNGVSVSFTP
jgi:hypothetical protein